MAATTTNAALTQYSGDTPSGLFLRPYIKADDWMRKLRRTDTPFSKLVAVGPAPEVPALKKEWGWGSVTPDQDSLSGALSDTSGTTVAVSNEGMWAVGDTFQIDSEVFLVTAKPGSGNLTVTTRGFAGSTAATHSSGATLIKLAPAIKENQSTPLSPITQGETDYNYFQQMEFSIQLSHRRVVTPTIESLAAGLSPADKAEIRKKMEFEAPVYLENQMLFGLRSLGSTSAPSTFGGLLNTASYISTRNTSLSGPLTENTLLENLQTVYNLVGQDQMGKTGMAHPFVLRAISSWYNGSRRTSGSDTSINLAFTKIDTGWFGEITLIPNYKMVKSSTSGAVALDRLVFFNPSDFKRLPYSSDANWRIDPLPEDGWFSKMALRGDWTLEAQNPDSRLLLGGFSTSASDYPGIA